MTSAARSSSSTDRRSPELVLVTNVAMIKEALIEKDIDEEEQVPAYSIDVSPEAAADAQVCSTGSAKKMPMNVIMTMDIATKAAK